jgi:hypothetical protein
MSKKEKEALDEVSGLTEGLEAANAQAGEEGVEGTEKKARRLGIKDAVDQDVFDKVVLATGLLEKIKDKEFFSEKLYKLLNLAIAWNKPGTVNPKIVDKDALDTAKEAAIQAFNGSENLKDYFDKEYATDISILGGIGKLVSILNNMYAFYHRRNELSERTPKKKPCHVTINDPTTGKPQLYQYSSELKSFIEDPNVPKADKIKAILEHKDTKKKETESYEIL